MWDVGEGGSKAQEEEEEDFWRRRGHNEGGHLTSPAPLNPPTQTFPPLALLPSCSPIPRCRLTTRPQEEHEVSSSSSWDLHTQLVVTTEVYRRTRAFMEAVHAIAVPPVGPVDLGLARDSLFGTFLASYPRPELDWLYLRCVRVWRGEGGEET